MICPNCSTTNLDNATICVNCGRPLTPVGSGSSQQTYTPPPPAVPRPSFTPASPVPTGPAVPNYLVQSILVTLCCCLPLGIVALVFSTQVNSKLAAGDVAGAMAASKNAKMWCLIAVALGVVSMVIGLIFGGLGTLQGIRENMG